MKLSCIVYQSTKDHEIVSALQKGFTSQNFDAIYCAQNFDGLSHVLNIFEKPQVYLTERLNGFKDDEISKFEQMSNIEKLTQLTKIQNQTIEFCKSLKNNFSGWEILVITDLYTKFALDIVINGNNWNSLLQNNINSRENLDKIYQYEIN